MKIKMKIKKCILVVLVLATGISCSSYKFTFVPIKEDTPEKLSSVLSSYLKEDELFLIFTKSYKDSPIKIYENNEVKFDSLITTDDLGFKGIARAFKVNKNSEVIVFFDKLKKPLKISKYQMREYKRIYIERERNNIEVEFNNGAKALVEFTQQKAIKKDSID
jgi:hypothetical protein